MRNFKEFGIKSTIQSLVGDKIKISKILNREIVVEDFRVDDSKYDKGSGKCLCIQFTLGESRHVVFTGSKGLLETIEQVPKPEFPFKTTIIEENDRYEFS